MRFLLLLFPLIVFSKSVTYRVYFGFFPAGVIKIFFQNSTVRVEGKSGGFVGLFYKYRFLMVYNLKNPRKSFLKEKENGKRRFFNYQRILKKKSWLPLVVEILTRGNFNSQSLKVGQYEVKLLSKKGNSYTFRVLGSKKTKTIKMLNWKRGHFPEKIEIETSSGTLKLERN